MGWGTWEGIQQAQQAANPDATKKKEAEDLINLEGKGICTACKEEIVKNDEMPGGGWTWESEVLLGYCPVSKDHKHKPQVKWSSDGGVQNA